MGGWDATAFGNDDAADWASELRDAENPAAFVEQTLALALATPGGYLEAPDGSRIVAAAAVIAAASGSVPAGFPADLSVWLRGKEAPLRRLSVNARTALQRVQSTDSELLDLWQDTDEFSAWEGSLEAIASALR